MKVGDLIQVQVVLCDEEFWFGPCSCWFCTTGNTRIGTVLSRHLKTLPSPEYDVLFGNEIYTIYENEAKVLNESR